ERAEYPVARVVAGLRADVVLEPARDDQHVVGTGRRSRRGSRRPHEPALLAARVTGLRARRRDALFGPGLAVPRHRQMRVPAAHSAEREARALLVAGRHAAHPVRRAERDRVLARAASAPIRHGPSREARNLPRLRSARASEKIAVRLRQRDPMAADLDSLDIISNDTYARNGYPHEAWTLLRREDPIHWNDRNIVNPFWAVTKHADIVWISKQPELFRNGPRL